MASHSVPFFPLFSMHSEREQANVNEINDDDSFHSSCMFCDALLKRQNTLPLYSEKPRGREGMAIGSTGFSP